MEKDEIELGDISRILLGEAPAIFLLEVFLRTLIIYVVFMVIIRLLGKRMAGQLTITELGVMLTLGAIVAPAMQEPEIGILIGIFVLVCVYLFQRGITLLTFKNKKMEVITQGKAQCLVKNGVLELETMKKTRISRQQIYSKLREKEIFNLGQVDRMYLEACGVFSIYKGDASKPGLLIFPTGEQELARELNYKTNETNVCGNCGSTNKEVENDSTCKTCESNQWTDAIYIKKS